MKPVNISLPKPKRHVRTRLAAARARAARTALAGRASVTAADFARAAVLSRNANQSAAAMARLRGMPKAAIQKMIREQTATFHATVSEARALLIGKSLALINAIDIERVHPNARALSAAILMDKALKTTESLKDYAAAEPTPQEKLVAFLKENAITFDQLTTVVRTGSCPDGLPMDVFRRLTDIIRDTPARVIDTPPA